MISDLQLDHSWLYQDPIAEITALKRHKIISGHDLIDLSMINPDLVPSRIIIDKLNEFTLKPDQHKYAVSRGIRKLRLAFQNKYSSNFHVTLDEEKEICAVAGTKEGLHYILNSLSGGSFESILVGTPTYPIYMSAIKLARLNPCFFEISSDEDKMFDNILESLNLSGAKILLLNFPNNPTGVSVTAEFWLKLAKATFELGVTIVNDFVYGEMGYEVNPVSALVGRGENPSILEIYSLSKAYSIPGWRIGAVCGDQKILQDITRLKSHSDYGSFLPIQNAASFALLNSKEIVHSIVGQYKRRMRVIVEGLNNLGWQLRASSAGPYIWAKLPNSIVSRFHDGNVGLNFARYLLDTHGIVVTPGILYGQGYNDWIRIALVVPEEKLHEVVNRISSLPRLEVVNNCD
jgi:alanine-synthesizing transaminase